MPKMVEVAFGMNFESEAVVPIPIGRMYLGPYIARLVFSPDGQVRLCVDKRAIEENFILTYDGRVREDQLLGFAPQGS